MNHTHKFVAAALLAGIGSLAMAQTRSGLTAGRMQGLCAAQKYWR